jgi:ATP-dependent helicase IRC3
VGRGTRKHPDKTDCLVLDVVGATTQHSLVTVPSLFGIEGGKEWDRLSDGTATISDAVESWQQEQIRIGKLRAEEAELFHKVKQAGVNWIPLHRDGGLCRWIRPLQPKERGGEPLPTVVLAQRSEDTWTAGLLMPNGHKRVLIADVDMDTAQGVANDYVRANGAAKLTDLTAGWRKHKPTDKQKALAKKMKIDIPKGATSGDVSDLIDAAMAEKNARRLLDRKATA